MTEPGLYSGMADADYREIDAVSQSVLKLFGKSAKAVQDAKEWPKSSDAFKLGTASDLLLFNPARFCEEFVEYAGSYLKDGTTWTEARRGYGWEQFKKEHERSGAQILTEDEANEARGISRACGQHQVARNLLVDGESHLVVVWLDEVTGIKCKAQLDYWQEETMRINDVKTTRNIEPRGWNGDSFKFGYHVQAAFYTDGMAKHLETMPENIRFTDIAVEKGAYRPDVVCYEVPQDLIHYGRMQYRKWLVEYAECEESGNWPGIAEDKFMFTSAPDWAAKMVSDSFVRGMATECWKALR